MLEVCIHYLHYTYNNFILNLLITHSSCTYQEKFPQHAEEPNAVKQLVLKKI